jgi:hypothetical protein
MFFYKYGFLYVCIHVVGLLVLYVHGIMYEYVNMYVCMHVFFSVCNCVSSTKRKNIYIYILSIYIYIYIYTHILSPTCIIM